LINTLHTFIADGVLSEQHKRQPTTSLFNLLQRSPLSVDEHPSPHCREASDAEKLPHLLFNSGHFWISSDSCQAALTRNI
jgi:hypothetical protein